VRCGRCEKVCPANSTGKPLSPQKVVGDLSARLNSEAAGILRGGEDNIGSPLVGGEAILEETLWSCTACLHCVEACPLAVNPLYKIIEMRRFEVLMEGRMPPELITFNKNLEKNFNPWGIGWSKREEWIERRGLPVPIAQKGEEYEVLLFLGCAGAFDDRYQRAATSLARLLTLAGVRFAVLGNAEKCCGEPARVTGNEYLFQTLARENIENIRALNVKTIVTACPHCQKTLGADYAELGGDFKVLHHSSYLLSLLESGKLSLKTPLAATATLHDSCYLSRYFCNTEKPRRLASASGLTLREMEKRGEKTFCCGGGGGRMWMEDTGTRIGDVRAKEALATGSSIIATSCPFCLSMLTDGVKASGREDSAEVLDLAEILERALT
jgi:Fe-S oxidoreductase